MRYLPYAELTGVPNVIADGHPRRSTVLTLSHWPDSPTPPELKRDLSAEIALAYLERPEHHVDAPVVSNNHFDVDGFMAVWALCHPDTALDDPTLVAEVARAGDFGWTDDDRAIKAAFALGTLKTPAISSLPPETFHGSEPDRVAQLHQQILACFGDVVADLDGHEILWHAQYDDMLATEAAIGRGDIEIEERADLDLAVVSVAPNVVPSLYPYCLQYTGPCHPLPVHRRTQASRVLYFRDSWAGFLYRFESWVDFQSRAVPPRIDLTDLAADLTSREGGNATWTYAWPNNPNPPIAWLTPAELAPTTLERGAIVDALVTALSAPDRSTAPGPVTYS